MSPRGVGRPFAGVGGEKREGNARTLAAEGKKVCRAGSSQALKAAPKKSARALDPARDEKTVARLEIKIKRWMGI